MEQTLAYAVLGLPVVAFLAAKARARLRLSRAKHRSLAGHSKLSRRVARLLPYYALDERVFFRCDGAPAGIERRRREGFARLARRLDARAPRSRALTEALEHGLSDARFTRLYRVPFPFREHVRRHLPVAAVVEATEGVRIRDLDGNWSYDLAGSYGVNLLGYDFYKACVDRAIERVRTLGPVLGPHHPLTAENVAWLKAISGMDEVSFHMSGTEAVMQAVALARYHTGRSHLVRFCGAYHGWWDGVQPGIGNPRRTDDVYTLKDMDRDTLAVLRTRRDIACVLVNPLQGLHPNANAPGDTALVDSTRRAGFDRAAYTAWLAELREVCTARGIVLVLDEVFLGFRLALGGAQQYFGVAADLVTYGKTIGGGLPVGVVCGRAELMQRFRADRPTDVCFARGTFNSHPYVMAAMNEFLRHVRRPEMAAEYARQDALWTARAAALDDALAAEGLPVRVANLHSVWTVLYTAPSRYNWMFQYYLSAEGLQLSWVGSGRLIFSFACTDRDFEAIAEGFTRAARTMQADGWWWADPSLTDARIRRRMLREMVARRPEPA